MARISREYTRHMVDVNVCNMCRMDELDDCGRNCPNCELVPYSDTRRNGRPTYIDCDGVERYEDEEW